MQEALRYGASVPTARLAQEVPLGLLIRCTGRRSCRHGHRDTDTDTHSLSSLSRLLLLEEVERLGGERCGSCSRLRRDAPSLAG